MRDRLGAYKGRYVRATVLCLAIADADREDAIALMTVGLESLCAGTPPPTIRRAMVEARAWASNATVYELRAYGAACVEAMGAEDRASFVAWAAGQLGGGEAGGAE